MKRTIMIFAALVLMLSLVLTGCSKASDNRTDANYAPEPAYDSAESFNGKSPMSTSAPAGAPDASDPLAGRKIIRNAQLEVETLEFDSFISAVLGKVNALGGYVQSNNTRNRGYYNQRYLRVAEMVLRVPAEKLDEFLDAVNGVGNVTSRRESTNDVTESYVDIEARLASLRTEYETLLGLLERAETLEEIITLQDRLTSVRYEIESYEARQRSYDSQIAFSTVTMSITEVERETAVEEETFGQETSRRFRESLEDVGEGFKNFAIGFIGNLPTILVLLFFFVGCPILIVVLIVNSVKRRRRKRLEAAAKKENPENKE